MLLHFPILLHFIYLSLFFLLMRELLMQTELMRLVASSKPLIAGAKISERILSIIKSIPNSQIPVQVRDSFFQIIIHA